MKVLRNKFDKRWRRSMKEKYLKPEMDLIEFENIDVLTSSSDNEDEGWTPWY